MAQRGDLESLGDLGLIPGVSFEEAKKKYRRLAMSAHPDRHQAQGDKRTALEEKFKVYSVAYAILETRHREGRWKDPWGASPDLSSKAKTSRASQRPEPSKASWGFHFVYGTGSIQAVAGGFFKSYLAAAARIAAGEPGRDRARGVQELAQGYLNVFEAYPGLTRLNLSQFHEAFLSACWSQEIPGILPVLSAASAEVARRARGQEEISDAVSVSVTLYKSAFSTAYFSVLDALATPVSKGPLSSSAMAYHREAALYLKPAFSPVEAFEKENEAFLKRLSPLLFAQRLLRERPGLFETYHDAKWFNLSHPIYKARRVDIARELFECEALSWGSRSWRLLEAFGVSECARLLANSKPAVAAAAMPFFEDAFAGDESRAGLPERLWTPKMNQKKLSEKLYWSVKRQSLPSWLGRATGFLRGEPEAKDRAFEAVAAGRLDRLELALSDYKSSQRSVSELERQGAPLAQFVAWRDAFEPGDEVFCAAALDAIKSRFGVSALRAKDPFGSCATEWMSKKIEAHARAFQEAQKALDADEQDRVLKKSGATSKKSASSL